MLVLGSVLVFSQTSRLLITIEHIAQKWSSSMDIQGVIFLFHKLPTKASHII